MALDSGAQLRTIREHGGGDCPGRRQMEERESFKIGTTWPFLILGPSEEGFHAGPVALATNMQEISQITRIVANTYVLDKTFPPFHSFLHSAAWHKLLFHNRHLLCAGPGPGVSSGDEPHALPQGKGREAFVLAFRQPRPAAAAKQRSRGLGDKHLSPENGSGEESW